MLPIPEADWANPEVLATWIELSVLRVDGGFALRGTVTERLRDSNLFDEAADSESQDRDPVADLVEQAWRILEFRKTLLGAAFPLEFSGYRVQRDSQHQSIDSTAAYTSMLLIEAATLRWYERLAIVSGDPVRTWFESITQVALRRIGGGTVERFGAPHPADGPPDFPGRVEKLAAVFGLPHRSDDVRDYASAYAQDASLDLVARWRIGDEDPGGLYLLVQCATGANWSTQKTGAPAVELWKKFISWNGRTAKAIAVPFALRGSALRHACFNHNEAVVFDRLRISAGDPDAGIDEALRLKLSKWCRAKFATFRPSPKSAPADVSKSEKRVSAKTRNPDRVAGKKRL